MVDRIMTMIENWLIVGALLAALFIGVAQVIMRYVFNFGIIWTEGALVTLTVLGSMMGGSRAAARGMHVRIMIFVAKLGPTGRRVVNFASLLITIAYCVFLIYAGLLYVQFLEMTGAVSIGIGIQTWIIYCIVPLTMTFFLIRYLERVKDTWNGTEVNAEEYID